MFGQTDWVIDKRVHREASLLRTSYYWIDMLKLIVIDKLIPLKYKYVDYNQIYLECITYILIVLIT